MSEVLEPRQHRSRSTMERLLKAAVRVLDAEGLDGATIPRIAAEAGVAPATIYRRFTDKEALLRAVFLEIARGSERNTSELTRVVSNADTLRAIASELVRILIAQYRLHPGLMRAMMRFAENDEAFRAHALGATAANFERIVDALLEHRKDIRRQDARSAATFALLAVATCIEARILEPISLWNEIYAAPDEEFQAQLTSMLLAYLTCEPSLL